MTDAEWLACTDPTPMLQFLSAKNYKRKLALFGVACCRHISCLCKDKRSMNAIEVAERYADRRAKINEVRNATRNAYEDALGNSRPLGQHVFEVAVLANAAFNAILVSEYALKAAPDQAAGEKAHQCALLRELFANPFQRISIKKSWLTSNVVDLANAIYSERAFDRMPILSDALMDAGCDSVEIIAHCRSERPHVRGCWVVDMLTGRK